MAVPRGFGPTKPWASSGANQNVARASWLWTWPSVSPQVLPSAPVSWRHTGPALLFPAEDSLAVVRRRLDGICSAAGVGFQSLASGGYHRPDASLGRPQGPGTAQQHRPGTPTAPAHPRSSDPAASRGRERRLTDRRAPVLLAPTPTKLPGRGLSRPPRSKGCQRHSPRPDPPRLK